MARAEWAIADGKIVAAIGEPGAGRSTMLAQAARHTYPRDRILSASAPAPTDLSRPGSDCGRPSWARHTPRSSCAMWTCCRPGWPTSCGIWSCVVASASTLPFALTAERFEDIPPALAGLVDTVVAVAPLRDRPDDVLPLAAHIARRVRGSRCRVQPCGIARSAELWLAGQCRPARSAWSSHAANRTDIVDVGSLPSEVLAGSSRHLSRIEAFERGEIIRVLSAGGTTMDDAARELGMSRATLYRKIGQYGIRVPRDG